MHVAATVRSVATSIAATIVSETVTLLNISCFLACLRPRVEVVVRSYAPQNKKRTTLTKKRAGKELSKVREFERKQLNMIDIKHLLKVTAAWVTIVYIICFGGVALLPGIRPWFMHYALHMNVTMGENVTTLATFISGLLIWNIVGLLGTWLFALLHNQFKTP